MLRKTFIFLGAFMLLFFGFQAAFAGERQISPEKRKLIMELLDILKVRETMEQNVKQYLNDKNDAYQQAVSSMVISAVQSGDPKVKVGDTLSKVLDRVRDKVLERLDLGQLLVDVYLPLYDKYFTEEDLQNLITFYKSPIGGKMLTVMPQIAKESVTQTTEFLKPRISSAISDTLKEEKGKIIEELQSILEQLKK